MEGIRLVIDLNVPTRTPSFYDVFVLRLYSLKLYPRVLLSLIETRFSEIEDEKYEVCERICALLSSWVQCCLDRDFLCDRNDRELYDRLIDFLEILGNPSEECRCHANRVKLSLLRSKSKHKEIHQIMDKKRKRKSTLSKTKPTPTKIYEYNPDDVAEQITYDEARTFRRIQVKELVDSAWQKPDRKTLAPHVVNLVDRFNNVSFSISSSICRCHDKKSRKTVMSWTIALAQSLYNKNNYNGVMEILSGLNALSVSRLKKTIQSLDTKYKEQWDNLNEIMKTDSNYCNYREELKSKKGMAIPFLGVFLRDLAFIDEGNQDYINGKINIEKLELYSHTISEIKQYQEQINSHYRSLVTHKYLHKKFSSLIMERPKAADDFLYRLSVTIEPLGSSTPNLLAT